MTSGKHLEFSKRSSEGFESADSCWWETGWGVVCWQGRHSVFCRDRPSEELRTWTGIPLQFPPARMGLVACCGGRKDKLRTHSRKNWAEIFAPPPPPPPRSYPILHETCHYSMLRWQLGNSEEKKGRRGETLIVQNNRVIFFNCSVTTSKSWIS